MISDNIATNSGGGIFDDYLVSSSLTISHEVKFINNQARFNRRPPLNVENTFPNIKTNSGTIYNHPLNDVAIGFGSIRPEIRTLSLYPVKGGEVKIGDEGNLSSREVFRGTSIQLEAIPASGYRFIGWISSDGGTFANATNPNTTSMMPNNDTTITANFELGSENTKLTFLEILPDQNLAQGVATHFNRDATDEVTLE